MRSNWYFHVSKEEILSHTQCPSIDAEAIVTLFTRSELSLFHCDVICTGNWGNGGAIISESRVVVCPSQKPVLTCLGPVYQWGDYSQFLTTVQLSPLPVWSINGILWDDVIAIAPSCFPVVPYNMQCNDPTLDNGNHFWSLQQYLGLIGYRGTQWKLSTHKFPPSSASRIAGIVHNWCTSDTSGEC